MDATYDPGPIVELFKSRLDLEREEARKILASLERCVHPLAYCSCGCGNPYFVDPKGPDWKFKTNVAAWRDETLYVLDIMDDWSVGGIEILEDFPMPLEDMREIEID